MPSRALIVAAVAGVLAAAGAVLFVVTRPETGPSPAYFRGEGTSALYAPIATRRQDPGPLTEQEVFGQAARLVEQGVTMERREAALSADCAEALWGSGVKAAAAGCAGVARASFAGAGGAVSGQYAVFDMPDGAAADRLVAALDPRRGGGFLRTAPGQPPSFDAGHSRAAVRALGHFVVVNWVGPVGDERGADLTLPQLALERIGAFAQRRVLAAG
ncbi:hypothetical protein Ssi03_43120 [Sphaerisporangium siamense]|uniref:Uncharacterized protein n=1 Tax=Sphaerisporangium siamense TaxID=795645 RepID=A0A7W7GCL7_9ACTN|nr:hypothetical protein [Sphaerisporangium siamense]MBB4704707.1 hypothetical protein [Sphaerisporangium siamense]GII86322.1 hypothetical protein Ssi03_43120 [Sphaerisporangium siamense]